MNNEGNNLSAQTLCSEEFKAAVIKEEAHNYPSKLPLRLLYLFYLFLKFTMLQCKSSNTAQQFCDHLFHAG